MSWSRRELCLALPALVATPSLAVEETGTLPSKVYKFDELPVRRFGDLLYRPIIEGKSYQGCRFSVHESALAPKSSPHPAHHHDGEEAFLVMEGALEVTINGKTSRITKGSVAFIGSGDEHGIRNPEETTAKYYVIEFGPQK